MSSSAGASGFPSVNSQCLYPSLRSLWGSNETRSIKSLHEAQHTVRVQHMVVIKISARCVKTQSPSRQLLGIGHLRPQCSPSREGPQPSPGRSHGPRGAEAGGPAPAFSCHIFLYPGLPVCDLCPKLPDELVGQGSSAPGVRTGLLRLLSCQSLPGLRLVS